MNHEIYRKSVELMFTIFFASQGDSLSFTVIDTPGERSKDAVVESGSAQRRAPLSFRSAYIACIKDT